MFEISTKPRSRLGELTRVTIQFDRNVVDLHRSSSYQTGAKQQL